VEKIVDVLAPLVTRFPTLVAPLGQLLQTVSDLVDAPQSFAAAEEQVAAVGDAVVTASLGLVLLAYEPEADVVEVGGRRYRRLAERGVGNYFGLRGATTIERSLYREVGVRNGPTVVPVELRAGIVDGLWTPLAAAAAAHLLQDEPSRDAVKTCEALRVMPYSRSSLDRGGDSVGLRWEEIRSEAEDQLAADFVVPDEATTVSASVDRVSVPMEEPMVDERGAVVVDDNGKARIQVVHRLAYCGVWTLHDGQGEPLHSVRYGRMPAEGHDPIEETLWGDLEALKIARPDLRVVGLADGAPEMQYMLDRTVGVFGDDVEIAIDFWHVVEKVADAVKATGRGTSHWVPRFKTMLRHEERGAEQVLLHLRSWELELPAHQVPEALSDAITYLDRNAHRMRYKRLRDKGLPIGSGHVEATCKTLVSTRMKRSGARWKTSGGQAVLSLRSLAKSSRWDAALGILLPTWVQPVREVA